MLAASDTVVRSLHLIGAAVWAGGMVMLALAVGAARRTVSEPQRIELFRALGRRFLLAGGIAMLVLIATGTDMAADRLEPGATSPTRTTASGCSPSSRVVVIVIGLTLFHSLVRGPALYTSAPSPAGQRGADRLIRRKATRAGVVSAVNLLATIAVTVLAARLVTG